MNLASIHTVTAMLAPRILIHGQEGVGKTTLASKFPSPIFLQTEDGCPGGLEINSFGPIESFADLRSAISALASEPHRFQTVVLANVVARCESMSSVETDSQRKQWAKIHDLAQMLEAMSDTLALAGCVLQQNSQLAQIQATTCDPDARRASANTISLTGATRALVQTQLVARITGYARIVDGFDRGMPEQQGNHAMLAA